MPFRVTETVNNATNNVYTSTEDFIDNAYRDGKNREWWVNLTIERLIELDVATEEERERFLTIDAGMTVTYGEWDTENQSVEKTRTYANKDDFDFVEEMYTRVFPREYTGANWTFSNKTEIEI